MQHISFSKTHRKKEKILINMMNIVTNKSKFKITSLSEIEDISSRTLTKSITTKVMNLSSLHLIGFLIMGAASQVLVEEGENLCRLLKVEKLKVAAKVEDFNLVVQSKNIFSKRVSSKTSNRTRIKKNNRPHGAKMRGIRI